MEVANVECIPQCRLGLLPQVPYREFADLVCEGLTRPGDVAVDLRADFVHRQRGVRCEVVYGLFSRPALGVNPGIDDQPTGAPHLVGEAAEVIIRRVVHAHFDAEFLGVEAPSLSESVRIELLAELRCILDLVGERPLQVMAGNAFVQRQRDELVKGTGLERIGIDPVLTAARPSRRRRHVTAGRVVGCNLLRHRVDGIGLPRQFAEVCRQTAVRLLRNPGSAHE